MLGHRLADAREVQSVEVAEGRQVRGGESRLVHVEITTSRQRNRSRLLCDLSILRRPMLDTVRRSWPAKMAS